MNRSIAAPSRPRTSSRHVPGRSPLPGALLRTSLLAPLLAVLLAIPSLAWAQASPTVPLQKEKMQALAHLAGTWEGEGWMQRGPGPKSTSRVTEVITPKLDGLLLVVEGLGRAETGPEGGEPEIVHQAFGLMSYDPEKQQYRFEAFTAEGRSTITELKLSEKGFEWGFPVGGTQRVRYTMELTPEGHWHEVGDFTPDGTTWNRFFEMTLQKKS